MAFENIPITLRTAKVSHPRAKLRKRLTALRAGIATQFASGAQVGFPMNQTAVREDILGDLDAVLAVYQACDLLALQLQSKRQVEQALYPRVYDAIITLEYAIKATFGPASATLLTFGLKPARKRRKPSAAKQAAAHAQSLETRKIRRTMGKKQRKAFTSGPVVVKVVPKK